METTLVQELDTLHAQYVAAVNHALDIDDTATAQELAASYDDEAIALMAEREGLTHLLPLKRRTAAPDSRLRRLVAHLRIHPAA